MIIRCAGCGAEAGTGEPEDAASIGWGVYTSDREDLTVVVCSPECLVSAAETLRGIVGLRRLPETGDGTWHD